MATIPHDNKPPSLVEEMLQLWKLNNRTPGSNLHFRVNQRGLFEVQGDARFLVPDDLKPGGMVQGSLFGLPVILVPDEEFPPDSDVALVDVDYDENTA